MSRMTRSNKNGTLGKRNKQELRLYDEIENGRRKRERKRERESVRASKQL